MGHDNRILVLRLLHVKLCHKPVKFRFLFRGKLLFNADGKHNAFGNLSVLKVAPAQFQCRLPFFRLTVFSLQFLLNLHIDLDQKLHKSIVGSAGKHLLGAAFRLLVLSVFIIPFRQTDICHIMGIVSRFKSLIDRCRFLPECILFPMFLLPQHLGGIIAYHSVIRIFFQQIFHKGHRLHGFSLSVHKISAANLQNGMFDIQLIRTFDAAGRLIKLFLGKRLPCAIVILQEQIIISVFWPFEQRKIHILTALALIQNITHKIYRKLFPQLLRIFVKRKLFIKQSPYLRGKLKMSH